MRIGFIGDIVGRPKENYVMLVFKSKIKIRKFNMIL